MHILLSGAAGNLGRQLASDLRAAGHRVSGADIVGEGLERLDICDFGATRALLRRLRPEMVLHAAAWTEVDGCAREPQRALAINGFGTQNVALAAAECDAAMLYISSNEVFDGLGQEALREYDRPDPPNPYGYSKWVGEQAVQRHTPRHYIVRTAWLFGAGGHNFLHAILGAARAGRPLRVVSDEVANPTSVVDLSAALTRLIASERYGTYHLVNEGACSRQEFARHALDCAGLHATPIERISSADWPRPSSPPPYAPLANLAGRQLGIVLPPWQEAVREFIRRAGRPR